ncbi:alpha/beta fold hydrolase [Tenacibaculum sp. C7A-26P2]|uniref:alpha/beta fold hydrolase n=1 Tax=Tenacibaculum sp. C7A-26P2 TaxID=3447504 RepID=UPI003F859599
MGILHSKIVGKGVPLLILHGYFGMGDNWKSHANKFANEGFEVHLIDQRNHGRSFHSDLFNYELLANDLLNYIQYHSIQKPHILGHSMGGKTAMLFAVKYADLLSKLVIADISPRQYPPHHHDILTALNSVDFNIQNTRKLVDSKLSELIPEMGVRQFLLKNVYRKNKEELDFRFNLKVLTANNQEVGRPLPLNTEFKGSVLFLFGSKSKYITSEDIPLIKTHFINSEMQEIINAGHWLHAENPTDFFNQTLVFLKK